MSDTPETDHSFAMVQKNGWSPIIAYVYYDDMKKMEIERNEAIRILRVLKSDIDHMGHWLPDPCRKMVETFLSEKGGRNE